MFTKKMLASTVPANALTKECLSKPVASVPVKRSLRAGLTAIAILGATIAGTGVAAAASEWNVEIFNTTVKGGSVQVFSPNGNFSARCYPINHRLSTTVLSGRLRAGQSIALRDFGDSNCQGRPAPTFPTYSFAPDEDVREKGLNCTDIRLGVSSSFAEWGNCRNTGSARAEPAKSAGPSRAKSAARSMPSDSWYRVPPMHLVHRRGDAAAPGGAPRR